MAKKMALVPPELVSEYYQLSKLEVRLEDNISNLLSEKETPDDVKAKLLSDLIPKYHRAMKPTKSATPFEIPSELLAESELPDGKPLEIPSKLNMMAKYIGYAVPKTQRKFILPILEKLRNANYTFNDQSELEVSGKPQYRSNVIDLFSYMMKNERTNVTPPKGFTKFFEAILQSNIPLQWIGNKRLREQLVLSDANPEFAKSSPPSKMNGHTRALRERLYRVFSHRNSYKYYDILPALVDSYNHSIHSAHGFEPAKVTTADEPELYKRLYHSSSNPQFCFAANDTVRVTRARDIFRKGYMPGWTEGIFRIYKRYPTIPPTYVLQDFNSKEIEGRFYNEELQKIDKPFDTYWAVEKIIRNKGRGSSRQLLIKWVGFPDSLNSWIRAD
ncbi:uncharacterized transposon-derived protein F54H12.3 [Trichonephila clavata]|uniref:Uncharacterized transposon-derived protein F54H12.3 n=1 Tax=Trichonephila clavata TaxID=2740835 RepID=A0A8X6J2B9_TRICU|nr:uncharacterized transposon-derived protein F54H12.3 [Trichonephila clavata]